MQLVVLRAVVHLQVIALNGIHALLKTFALVGRCSGRLERDSVIMGGEGEDSDEQMVLHLMLVRPIV